MNEGNKFYTIQEATKVLGISENEILKFIETKKIPVLKVGKAIRINKEYIDKFLESPGEVKIDRETEVLDPGLKEVFSQDIKEEEQEYSGITEMNHKLGDLKEKYDELLKKKHELEEDINYLQIEYEEFRNKIKKLVVEELKAFLKKIDNENISLEDKSFK